jgi:hypothetical protein
MASNDLISRVRGCWLHIGFPDLARAYQQVCEKWAVLKNWFEWNYPRKGAVSGISIRIHGAASLHWMFTECSLTVHWMFPEYSPKFYFISPAWLSTANDSWPVSPPPSLGGVCSLPQSHALGGALHCTRAQSPHSKPTHSGNIQGTSREYSVHIQGTLREHSGNI